jgi:ATP-dependent RNA helicase DDX23/PRP28
MPPPPKPELLIDQKEVEVIKGRYMGTISDKKKVVRPGDKFKQVFLFDWDASEDTS